MPLIALICLPEPGTLNLDAGTVHDLVRNAVDAIMATDGEATCLVLSGGMDLAHAKGLEKATLFPTPGTGSAGTLTPLTKTVRNILKAATKEMESPPSAVLLVNPLNPMLDARMLQDALDVFRKSPDKPLVSVATCRDHPCQFEKYLRLAEIDILYMLDPSFVPDGQIDAELGGAKVSRAVSLLDEFREQLGPAGSGPKTLLGEVYPSHQRVDIGLLPMETNRARLFFQIGDNINAMLDGVGLDGEGFELRGQFGHFRNRAALFHDSLRDQHVLIVAREDAGQGPLLLRLFPFQRGKCLWEKGFELNIASPSCSVTFPDPEPGTEGYMVCFLTGPMDGAFDYKEHFIPTGAPWSVVNGRLVNQETRRTIHGRQAFPEVVNPDQTLAVYPSPLPRERLDSPAGYSAIRLTEEQSLIVTDTIDYLRFLSRRAAYSSKPGRS